MGPVLGAFLVDLPLRFQARPIAADGWYVVGKPTVIGADGKEQTWWLDKRANEKKNLSFVLVQAKADVEKKVLPTTKVTWTLAGADRSRHVYDHRGLSLRHGRAR